LGHISLTRKIVSEMTYIVSSGTLNPTIPYHQVMYFNANNQNVIQKSLGFPITFLTLKGQSSRSRMQKLRKCWNPYLAKITPPQMLRFTSARHQNVPHWVPRVHRYILDVERSKDEAANDANMATLWLIKFFNDMECGLSATAELLVNTEFHTAVHRGSVQLRPWLELRSCML